MYWLTGSNKRAHPSKIEQNKQYSTEAALEPALDQATQFRQYRQEEDAVKQQQTKHKQHGQHDRHNQRKKSWIKYSQLWGHSLYGDPARGWHYYASAAQAELHGVLQLRHKENDRHTAGTTISTESDLSEISSDALSNAWSSSTPTIRTDGEQHNKQAQQVCETTNPSEIMGPTGTLNHNGWQEQGSLAAAVCGCGGLECERFFLSPEGVSRIPFEAWEVDLVETARLSSYYLGNSNGLMFPSIRSTSLGVKADSAVHSNSHSHFTAHSSCCSRYRTLPWLRKPSLFKSSHDVHSTAAVRRIVDSCENAPTPLNSPDAPREAHSPLSPGHDLQDQQRGQGKKQLQRGHRGWQHG